MSFPTTHWTLLAEATLHGDTRGRCALEQMCRDYHRPVFVVLRARGFAPAEAEDLTQDFFLRLFESKAWKRAERGKGRFRSFLLGALPICSSMCGRRSNGSSAAAECGR
jgi:RNA polymerase sigma-70 factor (ECF subfamily)